MQKGIAYDPYWRCEVRRCSKCELNRPLSDFYKHRRLSNGLGYNSHCKRCQLDRNLDYKRRNRRSIKKYFKRWYAANRERIIQHQRDNSARNKNAFCTEKKIQRVCREEKHGKSDWSRLTRTPTGRLAQLCIQIRRTYIPSIKPAQVRARFGRDPEYRAQFLKWKASGFKRAEAPVAFFENKEATLEQLRIVPYKECVSKSATRRWKRGDCDKANWSKGGIRDSAGRFAEHTTPSGELVGDGNLQ